MANRKLQTEIDRVLKKVAEGIEIFEETFEKINICNNVSQKEKLEQELKREIKKLQRLRDQIKTWLSSNEIKDKRALLDNRKLIETQMERFKALEREMKTKQYSKEGLLAKEKLDPTEVAKMDASNWITTMVDKLSTQVDALEAESELLNAAKGRRGAKVDTARLKAIEKWVDMHKFHQDKLEHMLRSLENDAITVDAMKDVVEYYVDSNQDPDFQEDEEMYDHLNLVEEDLIPSIDDVSIAVEGGEKSVKEKDKDEEEPVPSKVKRPSRDQEDLIVAASPAKSSKSSAASKTASATTSSGTKSTAKASTTKATAPSSVPAPTSVPVVAPSSASKVPPPPVQRYATAAAAAIASTQSPPTVASVVAEVAKKEQTTTLVKEKKPKDEGPQQRSTVSPVDSSIPSFSSIVQAAKAEEEVIKKVQPQVAPASPPRRSFVGNLLPESFSDLLCTYKAATYRSYGFGDELLRNQHLLQVLDTSLQLCPDVIDSERPNTYVPSHPAKTPTYYPSAPAVSFDSSSFFERFDLDTLFFIFYYQQGTRQQYLAARELKRQSWRFHKKYLTWFQRHEEPKTITDEYEQGTYIYFDYEGSWCQRKKTEFTFEYRYLEDD